MNDDTLYKKACPIFSQCENCFHFLKATTMADSFLVIFFSLLQMHSLHTQTLLCLKRILVNPNDDVVVYAYNS